MVHVLDPILAVVILDILVNNAHNTNAMVSCLTTLAFVLRTEYVRHRTHARVIPAIAVRIVNCRFRRRYYLHVWIFTLRIHKRQMACILYNLV
jgi:hypothetical protein